MRLTQALILPPVNQAIETFKNSDGAASEDTVAELENLFFIDPVAFVTDLSKHDAETQILIAQCSRHLLQVAT